jgi:uncharacterized protein (TIGR00251 family)
MLLYVQVKPNQRFNRVEATENGWLFRLRAPAVDGKANEALVEFVAEVLGIARSRVVLKKGQTSRTKCLEIELPEDHVLESLRNTLK